MRLNNRYKKTKENNPILFYRREEADHKKDFRSEFQRDRDRIIHSRAFRRLSKKTQVFNSNKGDHYRTRLTHSLEVSQIGRTIAKKLGFNEDLVEAIALGHDLGHTPFGHVIERTLNDILLNEEIEGIKIDTNNGFKHNFQSLHLVDNIEMRHKKTRGLNLTLAVRDGIIKHTGNKLGKNKINYETLNLNFESIDLMDYKQPITREGQTVALADEIAQSTHDLEDGIRSNIIKIDDFINDLLKELKLNKNKDKHIEKMICDIKKIKENNDRLELYQIMNGIIRYLINFFVVDAIETSTKNLKKSNISTIVSTKSKKRLKIYNEDLISNSKDISKVRNFISKYIYSEVVSSQEVAQSDSKAKYIIKQIFKAYYEDPRQLPDYALKRYYKDDLDRKSILENKNELQKNPKFIRLICDHIAGMTDNYAIEEYNNLYGISKLI